jgi:ABC-2 type transport system ATP-binding protein
VHALTDVSFAAGEGEIVGLLGVNGAGKSTLVRILSTLLKPDSGSARVGGFDLLREPDAVRRSIGVAQQDVGLDESRSVGSVLRLHARLHGLSRGDGQRRIEALLAALRLEGMAGRRIRGLSGGMRRKVDLALALVHSPPIVFLDEPTAGLDPPSRMELWEQIRALRAEGATILLTTQHIEEADQLADRVVILAGGRVVSDGTPAELKRTVAGATLELDFETAREAALGAACLGAEDRWLDGNGVRLPVSGPDGVRIGLEKLHRQAIRPVSARLREPSLEDLFLRIDRWSRGPG